jgi:hypothetical protein
MRAEARISFCFDHAPKFVNARKLACWELSMPAEDFAVTKRIKEATIESKRSSAHLAARIKAGYFFSYNTHPDRLGSWKF